VIPLPSGTKIWLVAGITDMRNGFNGLAAKVQTTLKDDPMSGHVFIFRGRSGSQVKLLWSTGDGLCLLTKRLERGRCVRPAPANRSRNHFLVTKNGCCPQHRAARTAAVR
jgi:transposase